MARFSEVLPQLPVLALPHLDPLLLVLAARDVVQSAVDDVLSVVGVRGERVGLVFKFQVLLLIDVEDHLAIDHDLFGPDTVNLGILLDDVFVGGGALGFLGLELGNELFLDLFDSALEIVHRGLLFSEGEETFFVGVVGYVEHKVLVGGPVEGFFN